MHCSSTNLHQRNWSIRPWFKHCHIVSKSDRLTYQSQVLILPATLFVKVRDPPTGTSVLWIDQSVSPWYARWAGNSPLLQFSPVFGTRITLRLSTTTQDSWMAGEGCVACVGCVGGGGWGGGGVPSKTRSNKVTTIALSWMLHMLSLI